MKEILLFPLRLLEMFLSGLPGPVGNRLRYYYWKSRLKALGKGTVIEPGVFFQDPAHTRIGANCWIDRGVMILAGYPEKDQRKVHLMHNPAFLHTKGEVVIGARVHLGPYAVLSGIGGIQIGDDTTIAAHAAVYSFSHHYRNLDDPSDTHRYSFSTMSALQDQYLICGPVAIGARCAVGLQSVILPGVTLGEGAWIGAGCVVRDAVPANSVIKK